MTYRELQTALKNLRNAGYDISVKLTASYEILLAEYNRLTAITTQQPSCGNEPTTKQPSEQLEVTPDEDINLQLGGNIKEPTANPSQQLEELRAIAQPHEGICFLASENPLTLYNKQLTTVASQQLKPINVSTPKLTPKLTQKTLKAIWDKQLKPLASSQTKTNPEQLTLSQGKAEPAPRGYLHDQRHSGGYSDRQTSKSLVQQGFRSMMVKLRDNIQAYPLKTLQNNPEVLSYKDINIRPISSYWIDSTQLGQKLDSTQVQALRNLEDGLRWVKRVYISFKALAEGFAEGGAKRSHRPRDKAKVIQLDQTRSLQVA